MEQWIEAVVEQVAHRIGLEIEISGRHIHLCRKDVDRLYGEGYQLSFVKDLSQPGQFVCKERVTLEGPKGKLEKVVILGPERKESQVEISLTDSVVLGIKPPIRLSGDISASPGIIVRSGEHSIVLNQGLIVAQRHIHMTPEAGRAQCVTDGQVVRLKTLTSRPLIFDDVLVRISEQSYTVVHLDYDEANACGYRNGDRGVIVS